MNEDIDEINSIHNYYIDRLQEQDYKAYQREEKLQKQLEQSNSIIREAVEYIYKNSIPIALTVNPPIHKVNFEGDINEVLKILEVENK